MAERTGTEVLARDRRNGRDEGIHHGVAVVVDGQGAIVSSIGDPSYPAYTRSTIKIVQAIPLFETGAVEKFDLTESELALCCASHTGADYHVKGVQSILQKIGMPESGLGCGGHLPEDRTMRERLIRAEGTPTAIYNNCSGKHAGMLACCIAAGWPTDSYLELDHPLQQRILALVAEFSDVSSEEIHTAVDGCSLPTYYLSMQALATMGARVIERGRGAGNGSGGEDPADITPERRLLAAINAHPEMVESEEGFDTALIRAIDDICYVKRGAMGTMLVAMESASRGPIAIAVKIADGSSRPMPPIVIGLLMQQELLTPDERERLEPWRREVLKNRVGTVTGEIVFAG